MSNLNLGNPVAGSGLKATASRNAGGEDLFGYKVSDNESNSAKK